MSTHSPLPSLIQPSIGPAEGIRNTAAGYLFDYTSDFVAESMEEALRRRKMLTTLEMARAEFGFYCAHIALYDGEVEPLHGHTFQVALRVSGEPNASGMVTEFSEIKPVMGDAVAPLRRRTLVPGHAPELQIAPENGSLSITCGAKRYLLPAEDVTVLPLTNTTLEALAGYLLNQVLPQLHKTRLVAAELEVSEPPGTAAIARAQLG